MIQSYGGKLALLGIVIGLAGSFALTRYLESLLYEVDALDLPTMLTAPVALFLCVLIACYIPARRVMRIDPAQALRNE